MNVFKTNLISLKYYDRSLENKIEKNIKEVETVKFIFILPNMNSVTGHSHQVEIESTLNDDSFNE